VQRNFRPARPLPDGGRIGPVAGHHDTRHPPHLMLQMSDLAKLVSDVKAQSATALDGSRKQAYGATVLVKDPSDSTIELIEPAGENSKQLSRFIYVQIRRPTSRSLWAAEF
jgi:hypothetical protein